MKICGWIFKKEAKHYCKSRSLLPGRMGAIPKYRNWKNFQLTKKSWGQRFLPKGVFKKMKMNIAQTFTLWYSRSHLCLFFSINEMENHYHLQTIVISVPCDCQGCPNLHKTANVLCLVQFVPHKRIINANSWILTTYPGRGFSVRFKINDGTQILKWAVRVARAFTTHRWPTFPPQQLFNWISL